MTQLLAIPKNFPIANDGTAETKSYMQFAHKGTNINVHRLYNKQTSSGDSEMDKYEPLTLRPNASIVGHQTACTDIPPFVSAREHHAILRYSK